MAQTSPKTGFNRLVKPSGVIKLKVKRKKATHSPSLRISNALKPINGQVQDGRGQTALKRKNPFRCSPRKKPNLTSQVKAPECKLFTALDGLDETMENASIKSLQSTTDEQHLYENNKKKALDANGEQSEDVETTMEEMEGTKAFPLDWSLKYKIRFTSTNSFQWCGTLKTLDEGQGLSNFVRCKTKELHVDVDSDLDVCSNSANCHPSSFCSLSKVWIHPSLPWLELFPRKSVDGRVGSKRNVQISNVMASALQSDWIASFRSIFNLTRVGFCPYFYLVANQNTMLFQAAGINREKCMQVIITPTSKGFRDALKNEGIDFVMPHLESKGKKEPGSESQTEDSDEEEEAEAGDNDSDDEYSDKREWLESMGLDKEQFPQLNPKAITPHQINNLRTIDQQPTSTVLVKGPDTHALFNFLLNCKSLISHTGPLAHVPPTLLAPVAFDGATLKSLKVNQGILKHQQAKGMTQLYSLELSGPLLPGCLFEMCQLLKTSQKGTFKATFSTHQPSVAFNVPSGHTKSESEEFFSCGSDLEEGISSGQWKHYQESEQLSGSCLKELTCSEGLYTWLT